MSDANSRNSLQNQIYLFVLNLSFHSRIFHSNGDVTVAGEGLQIFTYAQHSWPLSSEGSLKCYTHCDTGLPIMMVISEDQWHSYLMPSVSQGSCHCLLLRLMSIATGNRTPIFLMRSERSTSTPSRASDEAYGWKVKKNNLNNDI